MANTTFANVLVLVLVDLDMNIRALSVLFALGRSKGVWAGELNTNPASEERKDVNL